MLASALIIGFSLVLLVYWFRYSCALLLRAGTGLTAEDSRFSFGEVQRRLQQQSELDPLRQSLQRDYEVLIYLIEHASGLELESIESRLLVADYKLMQWQYSLTKRLFPSQARRALSEMASVLGALVGRIDEQVSLSSQA
ncbi:MAG TPA: hypothetical protein VMU19_04785 [Bryobacteraceae bacterium]|nr:hypothetical protein [Bryobacteraceae bacterium]